MLSYTDQIELMKSVDETKLILHALLETMLNDSIGSTEQHLLDILEAGSHTMRNILDSKILNHHIKIDEHKHS